MLLKIEQVAMSALALVGVLGCATPASVSTEVSQECPTVRLSWPDTTSESLADHAGEVAEAAFGIAPSWNFGESGLDGGPLFGVAEENEDLVVTIDAEVNYLYVANVRVQQDWPTADIGLARARSACARNVAAMQDRGFIEGDVNCADAAVSTTTVGAGERLVGITSQAVTEYRFVMRQSVDGVTVGNAGTILGIAASSGELSSFSTGGVHVDRVTGGAFTPPTGELDQDALISFVLEGAGSSSITVEEPGARVLALEGHDDAAIHISFDEWMYVRTRGAEPEVVAPRRVVVYSIGVGTSESRSAIVAISLDGEMERLSDMPGARGVGDARP